VLVNRAIEKKQRKKFKIPYINRYNLKPLLRELSKQRGLLLVEASLKTEQRSLLGYKAHFSVLGLCLFLALGMVHH
jgi:hypothetical protein